MLLLQIPRQRAIIRCEPSSSRFHQSGSHWSGLTFACVESVHGQAERLPSITCGPGTEERLTHIASDQRNALALSREDSGSLTSNGKRCEGTRQNIEDVNSCFLGTVMGGPWQARGHT